MTMELNKCMVIIEHATGDPAKRVVNNFWFTLDSTARDTHAASVEGQLGVFYAALDMYYSTEYTNAPVKARWYRMLDPKIRVAWRETTFHTLVTGSDRAPQDLALCMNFRGVYASGSPNARRRGRVFLGPFATNALNGTTGRPAAALLTAIATQGGNIINASNADANWEWVQYSPTDDRSLEVIAGWVDDTWDTIRSRDFDPVSRNTF